MRVSVIISTYNSPDWLEKAIWGYRAQSYPQFELLVADDGSLPETALLIQRLRKKTQLTIRHVWHEDRGFRKCAILNKAIASARGEYLVLSDGDCIPRRDFVETHVKLAAAGCMLSGGCVRLPLELSQRIGIQDIMQGRCTDAGWLRANGFPPGKDLLKLLKHPALAGVLQAITPTRATFNGHNASVWKSDVLRVNGFDERMEYGGLDRELGERLVNAGVRPKQIRFHAVCVHLDHGRPYIRPEILQRNGQIRRHTRLHRAVWTDYGIDQRSLAHATKNNVILHRDAA
jgi:glycosyltransferase involved in cell wall biosynthesis